MDQVTLGTKFTYLHLSKPKLNNMFPASVTQGSGENWSLHGRNDWNIGSEREHVPAQDAANQSAEGDG